MASRRKNGYSGLRLSGIERKLDILIDGVKAANDNTTRIIFALIGVIGSQIAVTAVGSPWYVDLAVGTSSFAVIFTVLAVAWRWKRLTWIMRSFFLLLAGLTLNRVATVAQLDHIVPDWAVLLGASGLAILGILLVWNPEKQLLGP